MNTTESVDSLYSSEARGKALASAGNRFVSSTQLKTALLDVRPLYVCRVLKEANSVIDVALKFDGRHAESRLLEVEADPGKPVSNPYCAENLESLITVVRTVLSSALEELRLSMPPDWEGSQVQVSQFTAAEAALLKRIDEEYPRRQVDFELRLAAHRKRSTALPDPTIFSSDTATQKTKKGRRDVGNQKKLSWTEIALGQLRVHHKFNGKVCKVSTPIGCRELGRITKLGPNKARRFFSQFFGSYKNYTVHCAMPSSLVRALRAFSGEVPPSFLWNSLREDWLINGMQKVSHSHEDDPARDHADTSV